MSIPTARTPSFTGPAASAATTRTEGSGTTALSNAPLKSAQRRDLWTAWTSLRLAHPAHEAEQKQKKRTNHVLPKPDNFIRYRQVRFPSDAAGSGPELAHGRSGAGPHGAGVRQAPSTCAGRCCLRSRAKRRAPAKARRPAPAGL